MNDKLQKIIENVIPFMVIGVGIAILIGLLFMFFYLFIWGVLIGGVLWIAAIAKEYFFPSKEKPVQKEQGRVIEHDDKK